MKDQKLNEFFQEFYVEKNSEEKVIDLHIHTNYSDGFINCQALEKYLKDKSYLIAVTTITMPWQEIFYLEKWE